ncbi:hypothetical protein QH639_18055 [Lysinibacillus sp. 1 U-2021]|uniref:hypothetical protein n=1 Tax=Lysinibacillus sp. 1 U-2021 TaxID=3039426 RepID=UPI002480F99E|nr:hypothetical protein [Lysinibacillus sp. 1 U-2021]WGT37723.1 hypothetical protein QH639_18055 [Lysinibacillus sp. 1 U-2021]
MTDFRFNADKQELDDLNRILYIHFQNGDIQTKVRNVIHTLLTNDAVVIEYDLLNKKILNSHEEITFESANGGIFKYHLYQVAAFKGIPEALNFLVTGYMTEDEKIPISKETNLILEEIMEFHKYNLIDRYLDDKNLDAIKDLFNT